MPIIVRYENFDLEIEAQGTGYRARVIASPVGQVDWIAFSLPFSPPELQAARQLLGSARHLKADTADAGPLDPTSFGQQLYATVFDGEIGRCLDRSLERVGTKAGLRIRLWLNNAPELADLPWEYLYGPSPFDFFALSARTPVVRYLAVQVAEAPLVAAAPLRILVVIANPATAQVPALDVEAEWVKLNDALAGLQARHALVLERLAAPTLAALQQRLRTSAEKPPIHLLHFIGHGKTGALLLENETGGPAPVTAKKLATLLRDHLTLQLVFLNACESGRSEKGDIFTGVAPTLVQREVPAVIAMKYAVTDRVAIDLAAEFYQALADGYPVDAALAEARKAVYVRRQSVEWGTPMLFSRSDDNRLFGPEIGALRAPFTPRPFEPATIPIPAMRFQMGRDDDAPAVEPAHPVDLADFRISKEVVSNREYLAFVQQQERVAPPEAMWDGQRPPADRLDQPMIAVTFADALAYCVWLSSQTGRHYRLPTEAEWECAATCAGMEFGWGKVSEWTCSIWGESLRKPDPPAVHPWQPDGRDNMQENDPRLRVIRGHVSDHPTARTGSAPDRCGPPGRRLGFRVVMYSENEAQP